MLLLCGFTGPVWAGLEICNDTDIPHDIAVGYKQDGHWVSEGWWSLDPSACVTAIEGDLNYRFYYYHARGAGQNFLHDQLSFCTLQGVFSITGDNDCNLRGYDKTYFAKIDTGRGSRNFSQQLSKHSRLSNTNRDPNSGFAPGTWGTPYVGAAVFHECSQMFRGGVQYCRFVGAGRVFTVFEDNRTPSEVFAGLRRLTKGAPVLLEGDWAGLYELSVELVLRSAAERAPSDEDRLLGQLQGSWAAAQDNKDHFTIRGSVRQNQYAGLPTSQEYLSVMPFCGEDEGSRFYLYAWDIEGGTGLCYEIKDVTESVLDLVYLPRRTELRYLRQE
jgi:uncharacterized membrane protein